MKSSESVFDYVHIFYYKCHKINLNCSGSYIGSPDWIRSKKTTIHFTNKKDNRYFQYDVSVA